MVKQEEEIKCLDSKLTSERKMKKEIETRKQQAVKVPNKISPILNH